MNNINDILILKDYLLSCIKSDKLDCINEFNQDYVYKLKKPLATVYIKQLDINELSFGDLYKKNELCKKVDFILGIEIFCKDLTIDSVVCDICQKLLFDKQIVTKKINVCETKYITKYDVYSTNIFISLEKIMTIKHQEENCTDYTLSVDLQ
ncbi:MAG: hypothetical protein RSE93_04285 [Oscillospiraceae bacterium]